MIRIARSHLAPLTLCILTTAILAACGDDAATPTGDAGAGGGDAGLFCGDGGDGCGPGAGVCGDGDPASGEGCDDGNATDGDGCTSTCEVEDGWTCSAAADCVPANTCGNGVTDEGESCDDANAIAGDGCDASCALEPGWRCADGAACVAAGCGDGFAVGGEACDDGNPNDGDGCSAACVVEDGWVCVDAQRCIARQCGDGIHAGDEACDDANTADGDGCAGDCGAVEPNYVCPMPGAACQSTVECGDRRIGPGEQCDDGNLIAGDGCDVACAREAGWLCPVPGARCRAELCGDGVVVDTEVCDDGNTGGGDGCSATCQIEQGWACPPQATCFRTTCGDNMREGTEQCDDGNTRPFDGCSQDCTNEPLCSGGVCTAICGDAVILPGPTQEACDDGNTSDGDGCSATCAIEAGWSCMIQPEPLPTTIELPLIVRDFKGIEWYADNNTEHGHPDFNDPDDGNGVIAFGLVQSTLNAAGRPVLAYAAADPADTKGLPKSRTRFAQWYDSSSAWNREEIRYLTLSRGASSTFSYDSTAQGFPGNSTSGFYPIDNGGWVAQGSEALRTAHTPINDGGDHNFNFTTETRFFFQYDGSEVLSFSGDDDLWVFIDGQLCLDVGGLHGELGATMNLADPTQEPNLTQRAIVQACKAHLDSLVTANNLAPLVEMVIFHAERHTSASNFELDLTGFVKERSSCAETCGDAIVTRGEVCDDGVNDGSYNGCAADCLAFGGYCGDALLEGPEACDAGVNANDGRYGGCNPDCTLAGVCGDGVVQPRNEVCDDAVNDGAYGGCSADCQMRSDHCGDGMVNGPEACDEGLGGNVGTYGGCNPDCTLGPRCGDGTVQEDEQCDDGDNDDFDGCTRACERPLL